MFAKEDCSYDAYRNILKTIKMIGGGAISIAIMPMSSPRIGING